MCGMLCDVCLEQAVRCNHMVAYYLFYEVFLCKTKMSNLFFNFYLFY